MALVSLTPLAAIPFQFNRLAVAGAVPAVLAGMLSLLAIDVAGVAVGTGVVCVPFHSFFGFRSDPFRIVGPVFRVRFVVFRREFDLIFLFGPKPGLCS